MAYLVGNARRKHAVIDGRPEPDYDDVYGFNYRFALFSQDSRHMAYSAKKKGKGVVIVDGQPGGV